MYTVWVIEKAASAASSLAATLMGDHAVRVFGSLASFETLAKLCRRRGPDLVVVDAETAVGARQEFEAAVRLALGETPLVFASTVEQRTHWDGAVGSRAAAWLAKPLDPLAFNRLVAAVLARVRQGGQARIVRFKDVTLDYESLRLRIAPSDENQELPPKEAQLLRLFIEHPGVCLSRDEIKGLLWRGVAVTPRTIDSHVSRLRKRLASADAGIEAVYGGGYIFR